ncbi:PepSY domain-containing protein [Sandaracinobacter sp. RS1-74]|uniref:PepSY-associated TM helix domain-containing protein n=1 Tax=Sandaracinobacteroides sayramensis TaxID=2913411 RepID=UPI001EDACECB|nr:PepSY-associated TM helix domain-containing protein [Sandaracinobacteroides sayramensis]MCG2841776.1 PepSY domain-containing protein [Sandaracinobacteroides sayramensis]
MTAQPRARSFSPSPDFVRAVLKGHSGLGLAFAAALYLVCLTGTLAVFAREFQRWENPTAPRMESVSAETLNRAYLAALEKAGDGVEHVFINLPNRDLPWLMVTTEKDGERESLLADADGELTGGADMLWSEFLTRLHIHLHLPRSWGGFIVGLSGVALLSSLISGILAHPRIFRDAFHLRLGGSRRLQEADLHNRIGVWALPFHVIVSLTGALLGLSIVIVGVLGLALFKGDTDKVYSLFLPPHPVDDPRPAPPLDLRPMFAQAVARAPDGRIEYVMLEHPTEMGGAALFNVRTTPNRIAGVSAFAFDREGSLYHSSKAEDSNLGEKILGSLGPLHFGWFAGYTVKIAYGILGLGLTYLAAGGVHIWLARRRDKGRPAPNWEKVWASVIWGQPLALTAAAIAAIGWPTAELVLPIAVWGVVSLLALAAAWPLAPAALSRLGRGLTGALLLFLTTFHAIGRPGGDPVATAINLSLAAGGLLLLYTVARPHLSRALV